MRSAKSVKRSHISKHAYQNKSHKKKSAKKAIFAYKEWKKTTYSSEKNEIVVNFSSVIKHNAVYNAPQQKIETNKENLKTNKSKEESVKYQPKKKSNEKVNEKPKQKTNEIKKSEVKVKVRPEPKAVEQKVEKKNEVIDIVKVEEKERIVKVESIPVVEKKIDSVQIEVVENPLTVDVNTKNDDTGMKASVDSGIDFNNVNHSTGSPSPPQNKSGSPSRVSASGNSFFDSVNKIVQTALGSAENRLPTKLQLNHNGGSRQRTHKLLPRDIKFCVKMLEKFGDDFESMSKSEDNVYMDTPSGIKRKIRTFKESPYYEQWQKAKIDGKSIDDILSC
uniref:Nucleolar protein 16 n=1 Tax=Strongyloides papillosus TaxID=174720 RepID=A0A0N5BY83_STREA